jgi:MYXO-CTERM domain-containing protein
LAGVTGLFDSSATIRNPLATDVTSLQVQFNKAPLAPPVSDLFGSVIGDPSSTLFDFTGGVLAPARQTTITWSTGGYFNALSSITSFSVLAGTWIDVPYFTITDTSAGNGLAFTVDLAGAAASGSTFSDGGTLLTGFPQQNFTPTSWVTLGVADTDGTFSTVHAWNTPEPSTLALGLVGLLAAVLFRRRRAV